MRYTIGHAHIPISDLGRDKIAIRARFIYYQKTESINRHFYIMMIIFNIAMVSEFVPLLFSHLSTIIQVLFWFELCDYVVGSELRHPICFIFRAFIRWPIFDIYFEVC